MPATISNNNNNNNNNSSNHLLHPCLATFKNGCKFGNNCRYANLPRNLCLEFLRKGSCSRGSACRFVHKQQKNSSSAAVSSKAEVSDAILFPELPGLCSFNSNNKNSSVNNGAAVASSNKKHDQDLSEQQFSFITNLEVGNKSDAALVSRGTETCDLFPSSSDLPKNLPPGFAYKLHTLATRADSYGKTYDAAKDELETLRQQCAAFETKNADLKKVCDQNENALRHRLEQEYAARFADEATRKSKLEAKAKTADAFVKLEKAQAQALCKSVKNLVESACDSVAAESRKSSNDETLSRFISEKFEAVAKGICASKNEFKIARAELKKEMKQQGIEETNDNKNDDDDL